MWLSLLLISTLGVIWSSTVSAAPDKIVCYHAIWSRWRPGNGSFVVGDIDTNLCTHIIYAFVGINSNGTFSLNSDDLGFLANYGILKSRFPKLKLLIGIGGWSEGSNTFSIVAMNPAFRKILLNNVIALIMKYNFDGLDFGWGYFGKREYSSTEKRFFVILLEEFRTEFTKRGYLLTAAIVASPSYYDVPGISKSVDFINVMTFDFTGPWNSVTGHHSTYPDSISAIVNWIVAGAPLNKLVLGIGTYGRSFTLKDPNNNGIGAPASGGGTPGQFTEESGYLGYNEICLRLKGGWSRKWSSELSVPYVHYGNQWVGYDDPESIAIKVNFVFRNNLAGCMIWSVDMDDFRGTCGSRYPLLNAIKTILKLPSSGNSTIIATIKPPIGINPPPTVSY